MKYSIAITIIVLLHSGCDFCSTGSSGSDSSISEIFFTAQTMDNQIRIYSINVDGSGFREIASNGILNSAPSKDGTIAFKQMDDAFQIVLVYRDGTRNSIRLPYLGISNPVISPDRKALAFIQKGPNPDTDTLDIINIEGNSGNYGNISILTKNVLKGTVASFSSDGKMIAYPEFNQSANTLEIRVENVQTSLKPIFSKSYRLTTDINLNDFHIEWSLDGKKIVYVMKHDSISSLFMANITNNDYKEIALNAIEVSTPIFDKDNSSLIFVGKDYKLWRLALQDTILSGVWQLTKGDSTEHHINPHLSPDGNKLIFCKYNDDDMRKLGTLTVATIIRDSNYKIIQNKLWNNVINGFWSNK
ncbi:MAG: hypothetical protein NT007_13360 [Candidatus Kapabacteria bacterium]|nr:hypothetical protein [Candidatus Kapabacteria bacterium]